MPSSHDENEPGMGDLGDGKRINFREYPSTGLVVLAAVISGLGWLAYKWSGAKRDGRSAAPKPPQQAENMAGKPPAETQNAAAQTKSGEP